MQYKMLKHVMKTKPLKSGTYLTDPTITILTQMMPLETHGLDESDDYTEQKKRN